MPLIATPKKKLYKISRLTNVSVHKDEELLSKDSYTYEYYSFEEDFSPFSMSSVKEKHVPEHESVQIQNLDGSYLKEPIKTIVKEHTLYFRKKILETMISEEEPIYFLQDEPSSWYNVFASYSYSNPSTEKEEKLFPKMNNMFATFEKNVGKLLYFGQDKFQRKYFCKPSQDDNRILLNNFMVGCI